MSFLARILWSLALQTLVAGTLIIHPKDTEAKVNDFTYLNCSTSRSTEYIHWHHGSKYVYAGDGIMEPYLGRFEIEVNSFTGAYNLVIRSVRPEDAGEYTCIDDGGIGELRSAQLIVLDADPSCYHLHKQRTFVESLTSGIESEDVQLACTVKYRGNIPPDLEWISVGASRTAPQGASIMNADGSASYALVVQPSIEHHATPFVCRTKRSIKNQHTCKVKRFLSDESSSTKASTTISLLSLLVVGYVQH